MGGAVTVMLTRSIVTSVPSATVNLITKVPVTSGTKVGVRLLFGAMSVKTRLEVKGLLEKTHLKLRGSPSASEDPVPSNWTVSPRNTAWSGPASAMGAVLGGAVTVMVTVATSVSVPSSTVSRRR